MLSGRRKLLLADDSPTIQKVVSLTFGDEGMEVVTVGDGDQALRALEDEPPPDVVLADVVMPGPDGYELCERVRRDGRLRRVPVVLLVGTFEPFNEAEARRVGADMVLTKPFQSIRDLVSKVGSLLGGGETKEEGPAAQEHGERAGRDDPAAEPTDARAADRTQPVEAAPEGAAPGGPDDAHGADASSPFADLGADDELIEAKPADAFGAPPANAWPHAERRRAFAETREPDLPAAAQYEANGHTAPAAFGAAVLVEQSEPDHPEVALPEQTEERVMHEQASPQPSFDTRAAAGAAADDALLDLGQIDARASAPAAEADDFILDLGDETPPPQVEAGADAGVLEGFADEAVPASPVPADAPSAFAEAARGETHASFGEQPAWSDEQSRPPEAHDPLEGWDLLTLDAPAGSPVDSIPSSTEEAAPLFGATPSLAQPESSDVSASPEGLEAPWRDVVLQGEPQGFGSEPSAAVESAPRGFNEPEVVPAEEPVPAAVEGAFADGSVEGDLPRPPAADAPAGGAGETAAHGAAPQEPSTAGYAVGEARVGLVEPVRAEQLSPEAVEAIARRVVELMSDKVVREIAWEVVPELAELLVKQRLDEGKQG